MEVDSVQHRITTIRAGQVLRHPAENFFPRFSARAAMRLARVSLLVRARQIKEIAMEHLVRQPMNPVLTLEIDRVGQISRKIMDASREAQLTNSLLRSLYSDIQVATVEVPTEPLDPCEQAMVEQALTRLELDGTRYSLVGASGSAKEGRFYAVESNYEKQLAERFKCSPQAAITYFGILVSSCKVMIEEPDCRLLVVDDHEFGTNDCRGWISQSIFRKLEQRHREELIQREKDKLIARLKAERAAEQEFSLSELDK